MSYKVEINRRVIKTIEKLPKKEVIKIIEKLSSLEENPYPTGSKKIVGSKENAYRVRQGDYRIIYVVEEIIKVVEIRTISHRKDAYK